MRKIVLASSSIHRKKLLQQIKLKFTSISPDIDESNVNNLKPIDFIKMGKLLNKKQFVKNTIYLIEA